MDVVRRTIINIPSYFFRWKIICIRNSNRPQNTLQHRSQGSVIHCFRGHFYIYTILYLLFPLDQEYVQVPFLSRVHKRCLVNSRLFIGYVVHFHLIYVSFYCSADCRPYWQLPFSSNPGCMWGKFCGTGTAQMHFLYQSMSLPIINLKCWPRSTGQ